jgi:transposase
MVTESCELTDVQWLKIKRLLPKDEPSARGGRRRIDDREVMEGILWVLRSGARWKDLPRRFPSPTTCWRRLREWEDAGVWLAIWRAFLSELDEAGQLNWHEVFADGTFAPAKKGVLRSAKPNAERVRSLWWWQTARVCLSESNLPRRRRTNAN